MSKEEIRTYVEKQGVNVAVTFATSYGIPFDIFEIWWNEANLAQQLALCLKYE